MAKKRGARRKSADISKPLFAVLRVLLMVMVILVAVAAVTKLFGGEKTSYAAEYAALVLTLLMLAYLVRWHPCKH